MSIKESMRQQLQAETELQKKVFIELINSAEDQDSLEYAKMLVETLKEVYFTLSEDLMQKIKARRKEIPKWSVQKINLG